MSFKSSGPSVALASYPGSGNSWVRQLLESATGIYTGAIYCDTAYVAIGMIGEYVDTRNVLATKTHSAPSTSLLGQYDKVIYLVRNPFSTILAEHNRALAERAPKLYGDAHTAEINYNYGMCLCIAIRPVIMEYLSSCVCACVHACARLCTHTHTHMYALFYVHMYK